MKETSAICLACGMCCSGWLSFWGELTDQEVTAGRASGLDVVDTDVVRGFRLPCPQYSAGRCAVYDQPGRPKACRGYRCWVLERYLMGRIAVPTAQRIVSVGMALNARVAGAIGLKQATALVRLARALITPKPNRVGEISPFVRQGFERFVEDLSTGQSGLRKDELIKDIFRAGRFLRVQFMRPGSQSSEHSPLVAGASVAEHVSPPPEWLRASQTTRPTGGPTTPGMG
jgi:hypothetical protein